MSKLSCCGTFLLLCTLMAVGQDTHATGQQAKVSLPSVTSALVPLYPPLARVARIDGIVHVTVTTDGHKVIAVHSDNGNKMLAAAAESNVRTWEFATHQPTTFVVTYEYKLFVDATLPMGQTVVLRLPTDVQVTTSPIPVNDPAPDSGSGG
jgi:hypothetical protein